ncbi:hypothetical protein PT974_08143 [Cladobotryum mycophilum]|uniref:Ricin B lectin domain-containing protein n=1 Tax=Cladobotryum mycophilum TaxID=491253 RepID=A0ABR0SDH3_9HYPO
MTDFSNLKAASLDPNAWYHVTEGRVDNITSSKLTSMLQITADGTPAVWAAANIDQYWQFQPTGDKPGRYQLRCTKTKIDKQLSVCFTTAEVTTGHTRPCMASSSGDDAQRWDVADWGDGSFRIVNVGNGTDYVMDVHKGNPPYMSSNLRTDIAQPAQHWIMTSHAKVDEAGYSTIFSASTTATSTSTNSPSQTISPPDSHTHSHSSLSPAAAAGIGIGVGLGVIFLALAAFFLYRRRRRSAQNVAELGGGSSSPTTKPNPLSPVAHQTILLSPQKGAAAGRNTQAR